MADSATTSNVFLVPGTASVEPGIQEVCHQLEERIQAGEQVRQFVENDWSKLTLVASLHTAALERTTPDERRNFAKAIRQRSGWWGRPSEAKIADANLERILIRSALNSAGLPEAAGEAKRRLRGPGVFALRHTRLPAFAYVGRDPNELIGALRRLLCLAFDGLGKEQDEAKAIVAASVLLTRQTDWQVMLVAADSEAERQALQNELVLRLGCLWPFGLNTVLNQSLGCLKELRELDWCRSVESSGDRSHVMLVDKTETALEARRLGLADLQFDDVRRIVFESDESGLYRCSEAVREFSQISRQLRQRDDELRQADYDACHRLHAMAAELLAKPMVKEQLRYRRDAREFSGWWRSQSGRVEFFDDSIANLDCLAQTLTSMIRSESGGHVSNKPDEQGDYTELQVPGVFVLKHRTRSCWRYVSRPCVDVLMEFRRLLHRSLDGFPFDEGCSNCRLEGEVSHRSANHPDCVAAAMLLLSTADEWQFELHPETDTLLATELYNRLVLQLDALWPGGANLALIMDRRMLPALQEALAQRPMRH